MRETKKAAAPMVGTKEQEAQLLKELGEIKKLDGPVMPALQTAQGIYGYLPIEVQKIVARELNVPLEHIFGVATFYSQFSLVPQGKYKIGVCMGTACYVKGAGAVLDEISKTLNIASGEFTEDGKFSLVATRCVGCCGLAPVLTVNDDVYGKITPEEVEKVLAKY